MMVKKEGWKMQIKMLFTTQNKAPKDKKAPKRPTYTHKGKKYAFKKDSPAKLSLDGEAIAITNLIKDEDAMEYLIEGENYFVERINTPQ